MFLNDDHFSDIWFSVMESAKEEITNGVYCFGMEKTSQKRFFLDRWVKSTNDWP